MRAAKAIVLYAVAVIIGGALLAPWLFHFVQWLAANFAPAEWLARQPFRRIFNRAVLIVALLGLWPLLRSLGIRSWTALGFVRADNWWRQVLLGFALGFVSFALAGAISVVVGARSLNFTKDSAEIVSRLLKFALTGIVVALIEETFFRGGVQGALQRAIRLTTALVVTSTIYSALHFLKPVKVVIAAEQVTWTTGFFCLSQTVSRSLLAPGVAVGFVTLFLAGLILGLAFARTGALYLPMGLHAGWVFTLKSYAYFTSANATDVGRWLGGGALTENLATWPVLAALFGLVAWLCRDKLRLPGG